MAHVKTTRCQECNTKKEQDMKHHALVGSFRINVFRLSIMTSSKTQVQGISIRNMPTVPVLGKVKKRSFMREKKNRWTDNITGKMLNKL